MQDKSFILGKSMKKIPMELGENNSVWKYALNNFLFYE